MTARYSRLPVRLLSRLVLTVAIVVGSLSLPAQEAPPPPPAEAQGSDAKKVDKQEDKKPPVQVGVELRWRGEFRDNFDLLTTNDADYFTGQRIRLNLTFNLHKKLQFYFQPQDVWLYGAERDKIIHDFNTNVHQAYFDWKIPGVDGLKLKFGRQEFNFAHQRLLGGFAWDNVGRSFDGAKIYVPGENGEMAVFWGRLAEVRRRGGPFRPGNLDIGGAYLDFKPWDRDFFWHDELFHPTGLYFFYLRDSNRTGGELAGPLEESKVFTIGMRVGASEKDMQRWKKPYGGFVDVNGAFQFGDRGPDSHRAMMLVANGGYVWDAPLKPMLKVEYAYASGDNNPTDGKSREFHNLFPTNHIHYGYSDLEGLRNLHNFRVTGAAQLHKKLRFEVDFHKFLLAAKRGAWKNAGGAVLGVDPAGLSGRDVGQELDFTLRLPLGKHLSLMGGYAFFLPGTFAELTRGPETHQWGFLQTVIRF